MNITGFLDDHGCYHITLNRPERGNALNQDSVEQLLSILSQIANDKNIRCLLIQATGKHFCTGVDLTWMAECGQMPMPENQSAAQKLGQCFSMLSALMVPKVSVIHGQVMGGGVGIVAVSDIVIADCNTQFTLPEIRLGLIPAIVMPYLIRAIGERRTKAYALATQPWSAEQAKHDGLVDFITTDASTSDTHEKLINQILSAPHAAITRLMDCFANHHLNQENLLDTGPIHLAEARAHPDAIKKLMAHLR